MYDVNLSDFAVYINSNLVPHHVVQNIAISYTDNNFSALRLNLAFKDSGLEFFNKYLNYEGPYLKDYYNVAVFFNGRLLFSGIVTQINYGRSVQEATLELSAISDFQFTRFFKFLPFNIANYSDKAVIYEEKFTYPYFELLGGAANIIYAIYNWLSKIDGNEFVSKLNKLINFKAAIEDGTFSLELGDKENELKDKIKSFYNVTFNDRMYKRYWDNKRLIYDESHIKALIKIFGEPLKTGQFVKEVLQQLFTNERIQELTLMDLILFIFQSYFIEFIDFPAKNGMSLYLKPSLAFAPVPDCNFIHPGQLISMSFSHSVENSKPTRTYLVAKGFLENALVPNYTLQGGFFGLNKTIVAPESVAKKIYYYLVNKQPLDDSKLDKVDLLKIFNQYLDLKEIPEDDYIKAFNQVSPEETYRGVLPYHFTPPLGVSFVLMLQSNLMLAAPMLFSYIDYIHYYVRSQFDYANATIMFDPNLVPGFPGLVFDGKSFIYGKVNSVIHSISSSGAYTSIVLTGVSFNPDLNEKNFYSMNEYYLTEKKDRQYLKAFDKDKFTSYYRKVLNSDIILNLENAKKYLTEKEKSEIYKNYQNVFEYIEKIRSTANDFNQMLKEYPSRSFPA